MELTSLPPAPSLPYSFSGNLKQYIKTISLVRILLPVALTTFFWIKFGFVVWIISLVVVFGLIWFILFILSHRTITLTEDSITHKNAFGLKKTVRYSEISSVKTFAHFADITNFSSMARLIVGKKGGGYFVSLFEIYWSLDDFNKLLAVVNDKKVPNEVYTEGYTASDIAREFPDFAPFPDKHPYLIAIPIALLILAAIVGFAILTT